MSFYLDKRRLYKTCHKKIALILNPLWPSFAISPVLTHIVQHTSIQFCQKQVNYFSKVLYLYKISDLRHLIVIDTSVK